MSLSDYHRKNRNKFACSRHIFIYKSLYLSKKDKGANRMAEHSLKLAERRKLELTGVNNVNSFDEEEIVLETGLGHLCVLGQELHIIMLNLDEGKVAIEGNITSLEYKNQGPDIKTRGKNILSRLLK